MFLLFINSCVLCFDGAPHNVAEVEQFIGPFQMSDVFLERDEYA